jgi:hypothetical protein
MIQLTSKVTKEVVKREAGIELEDTIHARKEGFHFGQCPFFFSNHRHSINSLLNYYIVYIYSFEMILQVQENCKMLQRVFNYHQPVSPIVNT